MRNKITIIILTLVLSFSLSASLVSADSVDYVSEARLSEIQPTIVYETRVNTSNNSITYSPLDSQFSAFSSTALPFNFEFNFSSNLTSRTFSNNGSNVTIRIDDACWTSIDGYSLEHQHFAIYLYKGDGTLIGYTLDMPVHCDGPNGPTTHSVTFNNVPKGDIYFRLSKPVTTYSYYLEGTGRIFN
ncbi:hypothetical protein ACFP56_09300 [Paenibacillus septentrionalis]|uniref:Uncharacterized protein n=1 Tax=Paenibacillus septentrionalis TaxID=429342 RepID=A0ABW1V5Y1_9BACL